MFLKLNNMKDGIITLCIFTILITMGRCEYGSKCKTPEDVPGICIPVKSCKPAHDFFIQLAQSKRPISASEREEIQSLHCGTFRGVHHICCEVSKVQLNPDGLDVLKKQKCGLITSDRVTNGFEAKLSGFPWMALFIYDDERDPYKCAGTLISQQHILTAAHCIRGHESLLMTIRLGEHRISTATDCITFGSEETCAPPVVDVEIEEFILHPDYHGIYNDIALIRLKRKVEPQSHIKPICLPIYDNLRSKLYDNYVVSGWGRMENGFKSDVLRIALLPRVDNSICQTQLRPYRLKSALNEGHICAGGKDLIDTCKGDSGGPLGYKDIYNNRPRFIQYGIVSVGLERCGEENVAAIYTNVSHYMQWITDHIKPEFQDIASYFVPVLNALRHTSLLEITIDCMEYKQLRTRERAPCVDRISGKLRTCNLTKLKYRRNNEFLSFHMNAIRIFYLIGLLCAIKAQNICRTPNLELGLCVPYKECPYVIDLLKKYPRGVPSHERNNIMQRKCSADNEPLSNIRLCCTVPKNRMESSTQASDEILDLDPNSDFLSQLNQDGYNILNSMKCGQVSGDRVSGGTETHINEYPWMALLRYDSPDDQFKCGGSLITDQFVMTAAHCVKNVFGQLIGVRLGEHNLNTTKDCVLRGSTIDCNPPVEDYNISEIFQHKYSTRHRTNDLALIKLDRKVQFKKHIKPICLPITPDAMLVDYQQGYFIAGWGATENGIRSDILLKARVEHQPLSTCQQKLSIDLSATKHICAGDLVTGRDNCRGDSGGPLLQFTKYKKFKRFVQYGIVASGGAVCDLRQTLPGIYTNVISYLPWITHKIIL
ncbi:ovochymase-like [Haematobia irritans]|uniref:ovochymase-like n=1 Tax=Haematobia irritans TaxID=7368 RepID=UPI003F4FC30A